MLLTKTRKFQIKKNPTCQSAIAIKFRVQCFVIQFFFTFLRYISYKVAKFGCFYLNIEEIING